MPLCVPLPQLIWASARYQVSRNGESRQFAPKGYLTDYFAKEAAAAITANKHNPFFLFLSLTAPHTPYQALKTDYDQLAHITDELTRVYAAMVVALDRAVGTVLASLRQNGLDDDTLVIFTNDNGAPSKPCAYVVLWHITPCNALTLRHLSFVLLHLTSPYRLSLLGWSMQPEINSPFRGWKASLFEGGLRVPVFMRWPAAIAPGREVSDPMSHVDLFPTLLAAADMHKPTGGNEAREGEREGEMETESEVNPLSGVNLLPSILESASVAHSATRPHPSTSTSSTSSSPKEQDLLLDRVLFWRSGHYKAIRQGAWKLQKAAHPDKLWLYNLSIDPHEWDNLAAVEPYRSEVLPALLALLLAEDARQREPLWPSLTETAILMDKLFETNETLADEYVYWPN